MRRRVPFEEGDLIASIGWTWGRPPKGSFAITSAGGPDETVITIFAGSSQTIVTNARGIEFQNAFIQEFGTKSRAANPYFRNSAKDLRRRTRGRITRAINKAIKET